MKNSFRMPMPMSDLKKAAVHPDHRQRAGVACTALAAFVYQFEANLVNVALPTVSTELKLTTTHVSLIPIVYLLGAAAALIPAGRIGVRFGLTRVFLCSIVLMTLGTSVCGLSDGLTVLLGGRLLQGLGAGGMAALGYALIPACLPPSLTGYGYGRLSMAAGLGMLAGMPAGGLLAQFLPWRFVFLASIPFMVALFLFSSRYLPGDKRDAAAKTESLALGDSLLLGIGAASAIVFLSFGHELGFASATIMTALLALAVVTALLAGRGINGKINFLPGDLAEPRVRHLAGQRPDGLQHDGRPDLPDAVLF